MGKTALGGNPVQVAGEIPEVGSTVTDFALTNEKLEDVPLSSFGGKRVLNIFPSIDTSVCATSVRTFNEKAGGRDDVTVLNISADLPFAQKRFCGAEGLDGVACLSTFRHPEFLAAVGVRMDEGPMAGLAARAVIVLDADGRVLHRELVPEIGQEPDYDAALAVL